MQPTGTSGTGIHSPHYRYIYSTNKATLDAIVANPLNDLQGTFVKGTAYGTAYGMTKTTLTGISGTIYVTTRYVDENGNAWGSPWSAVESLTIEAALPVITSASVAYTAFTADSTTGLAIDLLNAIWASADSSLTATYAWTVEEAYSYPAPMSYAWRP